ncbi:MAG: Yip1 family protein [Anaerolineae bacterium]|nr:Yip1 family protein [Anaerolineae bacterium]
MAIYLVGAPDSEGRMDMSEGVFDWLYGVIAGPVEALRDVAERKPVGWALAVIIGIGALSSMAGVSQASFDALGGIQLEAVLRSLLSGGIILCAVGYVIGVGILHLAALLFGGKGSFAGLFSAVGFAQFPALLSLPLMALGRAGGPVVTGLTVAASVGLSLWVVALSVIALREAHTMSTGAAIGTYIFAALIPLAVILGIVLLVALLATAAGAASGLFF